MRPFRSLPSAARQFIVGFIATALGILFLPKTLKVVVKRFVLGLLSEIVAVATLGLLTEKAVDWLSRSDQPRR